jgi:uncharacterized membrane protein
MLAASTGLPAALVLGRTLATPSTAATSTPSPSYFVGEVQNNQVTITYTVYNEQADPETGVLLTDTLEPGVTIASASAQPDQSGQDLAWSLGTIQGYDRAGVSLTVNLPNATTLQLDTGAQAYATLDAGAVSASTPAATLQPGNVADPSLLASTPDANTTDPFIQNAAAALDYDPNQIFNFLHNQIGYNSYLGSVRGSRGTLWSGSGNSLDVASLGIALLRASGIPAQYVQGTLSQGDAQSLILSMFPAGYQTVGQVDSGVTTSDPADDSQLLTETEDHYWFQFNTGSGFQDADPLMPGATIGQTFTTSTGTFAEVADDLREKTEVQLNAEFYSPGIGGLGGGLSTTTVLDQTFNDVDLVGHPLTVGNIVNQSSTGFIFTTTTNTYSPYLEVSDEAYPGSGNDEVLRGTDYQEVLTNFPLGSQILTGLFLDITLSGPEGPSQDYESALVDRIGYAARQNGGSPQISVSPSDPPPLTSADAFTLLVAPGQQNLEVFQPAQQNLQNELNQLQSLSSSSSAGDDVDFSAMFQHALRDANIVTGLSFLASSDVQSARVADSALVQEYADRPRLILLTNRLEPSADGTSTVLVSSVDLRRDTVRAIAYPGQATDAATTFNILRGLLESQLESDVLTPTSAQSGQTGVLTQASAASIYDAAVAQGIPIVPVNSQNLSILDTLSISAEAKARITTDVTNNTDLMVFVPSQSVVVNGSPTTAWYEVNTSTGETVGVTEDGGHQSTLEYVAAIAFTVLLLKIAQVGFAYLLPELAAHLEAALLRLQYESWDLHAQKVSGSFPYIIVTPDQGIINAAQAELKQQKQAAINDFTEWTTNIAKIFGVSTISVLNTFSTTLKNDLRDLVPNDPPVGSMLVDPTVSTDDTNGVEGLANTGTLAVAAGPSPGAVAGTVSVPNASVSGHLTASWSGQGTSSFSVSSLSASSAVVTDATGKVVGNGAVALSADAPISAAVSGNVSFGITGDGQLAFYTPAASGLSASGDWNDYTATLSGQLSVTLTTDGLTLDGQALPAGVYTIASASASLAGAGPSSSPDFSGSAAVTASAATVYLGPGAGTFLVGGRPLDPSSGVSLTSYAGTVSLSPSGAAVSAALNGNAGSVLTVPAGPPNLSADQNTPVTFPVNVLTSLADTYQITFSPPPGWTTSIGNGTVTATPAPGIAAGTYVIQVIAQSTTDPDLIAQGVIDVKVTAVSPGITLNVAPDPQFTVPYNGAQFPTAFRASIGNLGPAADTFNLTFANVPSGYTLDNSGTSVTIPAGTTGILGLYLVPNAGQSLPAPGTVLSFQVTATSTSDSSITQTQTVTFTVPAVDAVTLTSNPTSVNTIPGVAATDTITITNVGNVAESNVSLTATTTSGLTLTGLTPVTLAVGQSMTETVMLTPVASTPLNTLLQATLTATFGASTSTQTLDLGVDVVAPGVTALANASVAAQQLGNADLVNRLDDLGTALTNLVQTPTSAVYQAQAVANLNSLISDLPTDPFLSGFTPSLTAALNALTAASSASEVQAAVTTLGTALGSLATTITDEAQHEFTLSLAPDRNVVQPDSPEIFDLVIDNTGSVATTYDLSVSGLPSGVTSSFSEASVTVQPGQTLDQSSGAPTLTLTESLDTLIPANFMVSVVAEGAPEITLSNPGLLTLRPESILVGGIVLTPPYTSAGGMVDVSAKIQATVNEPTMVSAAFTVTDPNGHTLFTSAAMPVSLTDTTSVATVDLRNVNTTGFANGTDTITVNLSSGGSATTPLFIGQPVTGSVTTTPSVIPTGSDAVSTTVTVSTQASYPVPLTLQGAVTTPSPGTSVALYTSGGQTYAYESGTNGIDDINVTDPTNPQLIEVFGQASTVDGSSGLNVAKVVDGYLFVATTIAFNAGKFNLLVFSLTDPTNPTLVSNTSIDQEFLSDLFVNSTGTEAFVPLNGVYISGPSPATIYSHFGNFAAINLSDPTMPTLDSVLFNDTNYSNDTGLGQFGGTLVNDQTAYVTGLTPGGDDVADNTGNLLVVDVSDPTNMTITTSLVIPNTNNLIGAAIYGNEMLVIGSAGPQSSIVDTSLTGVYDYLSLTLLDITDPNNPTIVGQTFVTPEQFPLNEQGQKTDVVSLGNGDFAVSDTDANGNPALLVIDPSNPNDMIVGAARVPSGVHGITVEGGMLYASTSDGLSIYQIQPLVSDPVTVTVNLPAGTAANIVSGSFNAPPTQIVTSATGDQLIWDRSFASGNTTYSFTWQTMVSGVTAGQDVPIVTGASVVYQDLGTPGSIDLTGSSVTGTSIISVTPQSATVQPGGTVTYNVRLTNPTDAPATYDLSVQDTQGDFSPPALDSVTVPADGVVDVPLTLTAYNTAIAGNDSFTVTADDTIYDSTDTTVIADYHGTASAVLTIAGQPIPTADLTARGVVLSLSPSQGSIGQDTAASYVIQVTNVGSADDQYNLTVSGLPSEVNASFSTSSLYVPPGASNFRDVVLTLSASDGSVVTPGAYPFTVSAQSVNDASITGSVSGTLTVTSLGVNVSLDNASGSPGDTFTMTVTNTGSVTDTYDLSLAGPAALVASLGMSQVQLAPGASQVVPISTGAVDFAVPGTLPLTAAATSASNAAVQGAATSELNIPDSQGMTATFSPASQTLSQPGTATFLLMVHNTGNTEDSYSATIMGANGPITATLVGLDGSPTQSIPTFRLPGLSTGAIELQTDLSAIGLGTVTVDVQSLTNSGITATPAASVLASQQVIPPPVIPPPVIPALVIPPQVIPPPVATDGPQVKELLRYGYHMRPTTLVLTFDQALDPTTAQDAKDYRIVGREGRIIRIKSAVYDPTTLSVTLDPRQRINVHHGYELIVDGSASGGVTNAKGQLLDGEKDGQPGSDYRASITWRNLVLGPRLSSKYSRRSKTTPTAKDHRPKSHAAHAVSHKAGLFTRSLLFRGEAHMIRSKKSVSQTFLPDTALIRSGRKT